MSDQALLDRLNQRHPKVIDLSLDRIQTLLKRLDNPEKQLPPTIHVAGTNGKGSVIAFMRAMAEAANLKVHVYTSPHLVSFNERIRVAGTLIDNSRLLELLEECEHHAGDDPITFFEITTAVGFLAFARTPADLVLLETGLGGKLDATNVLEQPAVTALTPISLDHQQYLGTALSGIAAEKAAIMRKGVPCVAAHQTDEVTTAINKAADEIGSALQWEGRAWSANRERGRVVVRTPKRLADYPVPVLSGDHQIHNAAQAVTALDAVPGLDLPDPAIARGFSTAEWPARLQRLAKGPLVAELPPGWEIWIDGGHNEAAGQILGAQAAKWSDKPLALIFGMLNTKDPKAFLRPLSKYVQTTMAIKVPGEDAALSAEDAAGAAKSVGMEAIASSGPNRAIQRIMMRHDRPSRILICGSLYLAGDILKSHS